MFGGSVGGVLARGMPAADPYSSAIGAAAGALSAVGAPPPGDKLQSGNSGDTRTNVRFGSPVIASGSSRAAGGLSPMVLAIGAAVVLVALFILRRK